VIAKSKIMLMVGPAVAALAVAFGIWAHLGGLARISAYMEARKAFLASRPGRVGSYEFVARGVEYGMSPEQVDKIMSSAYESYHRMPMESPPWPGFVNSYMFRYGPPWNNRLAGDEAYEYEELYYVYFDREGHASRLLWSMQKGDVRTAKIDLKAKQFIPKWE